MTTHVLLVEDDDDVRQALVLSLKDYAYDVAEARTGEDALHYVELRRPDVVLLDLMLPGMDGIEVCRRIRRDGDLPIIVVTGRSETSDIVEGLQCGADDYVTKPVVTEELSARISTVLRRVHHQRSTTIVGDLELRPEEGSALRRGEDLHLTKTEFRLLHELVGQSGAVVTREQLLERVWGYGYFGDTRLLDVHIRRLRTKVEDDPAAPALIQTVRGTGYRIKLG